MRDKKTHSPLFPHYNSEQGLLTVSAGNQLKFQRQEIKKCNNSGKHFVLLLVIFNEWTGKIEDTLQLTLHIQCRLSISEWSECGVHRKPRLFELVTKRIKDFGLAMDNIVAFVTNANGASIMMKLRRLAPCEF